MSRKSDLQIEINGLISTPMSLYFYVLNDKKEIGFYAPKTEGGSLSREIP